MHDSGFRLTSRREFLHGSLGAALPVMVGAPLWATKTLAAAPQVLPTVLIDDRHPEARAFGAALAARGALVHALPEGDVTAQWRASIGPAWRHTPSVVAGLTRSPALFCLEQLGWGHGRRVVFCGQHLLSPTRPARHTIIRASSAGAVWDSRALLVCGRRWPARLAAVVAMQSALPKIPRAGPTHIDLAPSLPANTQMLTSWIIAPV